MIRFRIRKFIGPKLSRSYLNFSLNFLLNNTGISEKVAKTTNIRTDVHESILLDEVSLCKVVPAWIAINEGGATPKGKIIIKVINRFG